MADQSVRGRFVWHELVTPDSNAAHAFYGKAIGWKSQPWEEDASYVMFAAKRGPIGATVAGNGSAPHWVPYVGTGDLDRTIELAKQKGGSVVKDVATLSSGSRYAVLQDPYGAKFGIYESAEDYGKITPPQPGEHSWHELISTDHEGAFDFYSALFGWQNLVEHDMGEMGTYLIYGVGDVRFGGMMTMKDGPGSSWLSYVQVKDVNQTAKKVKSAGGKVINGPMEVPGGDWIVQAVDPQGAMFAAHALAADMKKPEKKPKQAKQMKQPEQLKLDTEETPPPVVQDPETPAEQEAPPADKPPEEPAQKPAKKAPARKAPAKEAPAEAPAEEAPAKQAPAKKSPAKKAPAKKAPAKKAPAKKKSTKTPAKKKAGKKRPAAKGAGSKKSAARKGAKSGGTPGKKSGGTPAKKKGAKASSKTRSGGKKKAVKKPRKGK